MAVPFLDRVRVSGRRTPDDPPTYAGDVILHPKSTVPTALVTRITPSV